MISKKRKRRVGQQVVDLLPWNSISVRKIRIKKENKQQLHILVSCYLIYVVLPDILKKMKIILEEL